MGRPPIVASRAGARTARDYTRALRTWVILVGFIALGTTSATPALAQRFPFEQSLDVTEPATLDVSTLRGKIDVTAGEPGRIVVTGAVTVRLGWNVPVNAVDLAQKVAANPPIQRDTQTITLRPPADPTAQRAVTVSYQVRVPANTRVQAVSDSGATSVRGVSGTVVVRTQSGAIELMQLGDATEVTTGSGSVAIDGVGGALTVTTSSSGVVGRSLRGDVHVRTGSGSVEAELSGEGNADVETSSSAIRIIGVRGALRVSTQSGRVSVSGVPNRSWTAYSGSGSLEIAIDSSSSFSLGAMTGSGSVSVDGATVQGSVSKREVSGDIGAGGPLVRVSSRSGSIRVRLTPAAR